MSCIITYKGKKYSDEQFKEYFINNRQEFATSIAKNKNVIDSFKRKMEGIDYVFSQSPELASIGTKAQYLQYLSTIFKTSKVKEIVYHGTARQFEKFQKGNKINKSTELDAFYFADNIDYAKHMMHNAAIGMEPEAAEYQFELGLDDPEYKKLLSKGRVISAILNIKNPTISTSKESFADNLSEKSIQKGTDGVRREFIAKHNNEWIAFESEQIHILGSKQDIEGFKEFVNENKSNKVNLDDIITDLLANYSYTVEINTSKEKIKSRTKEVQRDPLKFYSNSQNRYYRDTEELGWISSEETEIDLSIDFFKGPDLEISSNLKDEFQEKIEAVEREWQPLLKNHVAFKLSTNKKGEKQLFTEVYTSSQNKDATKVFINETAVKIKGKSRYGVAEDILKRVNKELLSPEALRLEKSVGRIKTYSDGRVAIEIIVDKAMTLAYSVEPNFMSSANNNAVKYFYLSQFLSEKNLLIENATQLNDLYLKGRVQEIIDREKAFLQETEKEIKIEEKEEPYGDPSFDLSLDLTYENKDGLYAIPNFNAVKLKREAQIKNLQVRIDTFEAKRRLEGEVDNITDRKVYLENLQKELQKDLDNFLSSITEEEKFSQIEAIFKKDFKQVRDLLSNPTIENISIAKDMIDYIEINSSQEDEKSIFGLKKGEISNPAVEELKSLLHKEKQLLKSLYEEVTDAFMLDIMMPSKENFFKFYPKGSEETDIEALSRIRDTHLKSVLEDISEIEQQFLAEGRNLSSDSDLLAQMRRLLYEAEEHKKLAQASAIKQKINAILPALEERLKELGYVSKGTIDYINYISLFYRTDSKGNPEATLVSKFSEQWNTFINNVFSKSREELNELFKDKKAQNVNVEVDKILAKKYKALDDNTEFIDFRLLHEVLEAVPFFNTDLYKSGTPQEAEAYKQSIIAKIGQDEYEEVVKKQINHLKEFLLEAKTMEKVMLADPNINPENVTDITQLEQKYQNQLKHSIDRIDPFVLLDSHFTGNRSFVHFVQSIVHNHYIKYNTFIPKEVNSEGKRTEFYDEKFKFIEKDPILREAWRSFEEASYFINSSLISSGKLVSKGSLLWFKKQFKEEYLNRDWKDTLKKQVFSDFLQDGFHWLKTIMAAEKNSEQTFTDIKLPNNMSSFSSQVAEEHKKNVILVSTLFKRVLKPNTRLDLNSMNIVEKESLFETLGVTESSFRSLVKLDKGVFKISDLKPIARQAIMETQTLNLPLMLKVQLEQAAINAARTSTTEKMKVLLQKSEKQKEEKTIDNQTVFVPRTKAEQKSSFWVNRIVSNQIKNKHQEGKKEWNLISSWAKKIKRDYKEGKEITTEDWKKGLNIFNQNLTREEKAKYKILVERLEVVSEMLDKVSNIITNNLQGVVDNQIVEANSEAAEELVWNLKEEKVGIEQQLRLMGKDLMWSALLTNSFQAFVWKNMAWNYVAQLYNASNARAQLYGRDGEFWTPGHIYKALAFVDMRWSLPFDKNYAKQWAIGEALIERLNIISDGSNEFQRSERKGTVKSPKLFRKLYGTLPVPNYELASDPMYAIKYVEYYNQIPIFYCKAMDKEIVDKNGKAYPLFDGMNFIAFDIDEETKTLKLKPDFDTNYNRDTFLAFKNDDAASWAIEIKVPINSINGDYSLVGSTLIKESLLGKPTMAYKTWVGEAMIARYSYNQKELSTGTIRDGYISGSLANTATKAQGLASLFQITSAGVVFGSAAIAGFPAGVLAITGGIAAFIAIYSGAKNYSTLRKLVLQSAGQNPGLYVNLNKAFKQVLLTNTVGLIEMPTNKTYAVLQKLRIINHLDKEGKIKKPLIDPYAMVVNHKELLEQGLNRELRSLTTLVRFTAMTTLISLLTMLSAGDDEEEKELEGKEDEYGNKTTQKVWSEKQKQKELDKKHSFKERARILAKNSLGRTLEETSLGTNPLTILNMFISDDSTIKGGTIPFTEYLGESWLRASQGGEEDLITNSNNPYYGDSKLEVGLRRNVLVSPIKNLGKEDWFLGLESNMRKDYFENNYENWFKETDLKEDQKRFEQAKAVNLVKIKEKVAQELLKKSYKEIKNAQDLEAVDKVAAERFKVQMYSPKKESRGFYTEDQRRISTPASEIYFKSLEDRE